ncbi:MAG: ABC transporter ATP-binding protein [Bacteroidetes bacterium]|nr:ABC transporter ATP-binding protein [Bacteroidota bacterium]
MADTTMISTKGLAVGYANKIILQDINLTVPQGSVLAVLGLNGSGKSTFLRSVAGLQKSLKGGIFLDEKLIQHYSEFERAKKMSLVLPGRGDMVQGMFVHELFSATRAAFNSGFGKLSGADIHIIEKIIADLKIERLVQKRLYQLSDGEAQMVFIARALIQDTPVILLDEPTSFLDVVHKVEIFSLLAALRKAGKTVVFTSHEIDIALQVADYCLMIGKNGQHVFGTQGDVVARGVVEELFQIDGVRFDRNSLRMEIDIR